MVPPMGPDKNSGLKSMSISITGLAGQWLGQIDGTNTGNLILNIDADRPAIGWLQLNDPQQPLTATIIFNPKGSKITGNLTQLNTGHYPRNPEVPCHKKVTSQRNSTVTS